MVTVALFSIILVCVEAAHYEIETNRNVVAASIQPTWLISTFRLLDRVSCVIKCNLNVDCLSLVYDLESQCWLYKKNFTSSELVFSPSVHLLFKSTGPSPATTTTAVPPLTTPSPLLNLNDLFEHGTQSRSIVSDALLQFQTLYGFEIIQNGSHVFYYVIDKDQSAGTVIVYDEYWAQPRVVSLPTTPTCVKLIDDELFIVCEGSVFKYTNNLEYIHYEYNMGANSRGCYHHERSDTLYVGSSTESRIDVFHRNLTKLDSLTVSFPPFTIIAYQERIYLGSSTNGTIAVMDQNRTIVSVYGTVCGTTIHSMYIDTNGYMLIGCSPENQLHLYHTNGSYMNKSLNSTDTPSALKFDASGSFIVMSYSQIDFYN